MVKSVFGPYREVITLIPRYKETGNQLHDHCVKNLILLNELGAKVVAITTDNNRVNENMFKAFGINRGNISIGFHPLTNENFFAFYDSVHIVINLRNNWITKKDPEHSMTYYDFVNGCKVKKVAKFSHLCDLFLASGKDPITISSKLTLKSLSPSSLDRQKNE